MISLLHIGRQGIELNTVIELFKAYANELNEDLCFQSFNEELENPLLKYGHSDGDLILAKWNEEVAGCVALQNISGKMTSHQSFSDFVSSSEETICEMKRLYVKPNFRHKKIGEALVVAIIESAKTLGYDKMKLDTLEKLQPAIELYKKHGFVITNAYYSNPLPNVVYMELPLK